jgi:hypothetical protein
MITLVQQMSDASHLEASIRSHSKILDDWALLYPDDFETQDQVATARFRLATTPSSAGGYQADRNAAAVAIDELVKRFPKEARAHRQVARVDYYLRHDLLQALRDLKTCKALDPKLDCGSELYAQIAAFYTLPYCAKADLAPGLALYRGNPRGSHPEASRPVTLDGRRFWTATGPFLRPADIQSITTTSDKLVITLTDEGETHAQVLRISVDWIDGWTFVFVGSTAVAGADWPDWVPPQQQLQLQAKGFDLGRLCRRVQRRALPKELAPALL